MADKFSQPTIGRRSFLKASAAATAMMVAAGCGKKSDSSSSSTTTAASSTSSGTLTYFITSPVSIDPFNDQDVYGDCVAYQLFDTLTSYDFEKDELTCLACESYEANSAADEFTFKIRQGNKFHNGETVDAASFKRAWERVCNPKTTDSPSVVSYNLKYIEGYDAVLNGSATDLTGITCPDEYTLKVKLSQPYADFPYVVSIAMCAPVPKAALDDFATYNLAPIGNGPFQMDGKWEDGQYINVKRYEDYANGDKPKLSAIHFNIQKDVETAYKEFQAGTIDVAEIPTSQMTDAISTYGKSEDGYTITPGKQVLNGAEPSPYFLTVNQNPTFKNSSGNVVENQLADVHLRHAISLAINRDAICDTLFNGTRDPAGNIVAPGIKGYKENEWTDAHYDKNAAIALLDQYYPADASGSRGINLELSYNKDGSHKQVMESVISDLNAVGINVTSVTKEFASILQDYDDAAFQFGRLGWQASYPTMDAILFPLFYTGNGDNTSHYSNATYDALIDKAHATTDDSAREEIYHQANALLSEDMPAIPIMYYKHAKVGSSKCKNVYISPMEITKATNWEVSA